MKRLKWVELHSLRKQLGRKVTTRDRKNARFGLLKEHITKRKLWKTSTENKAIERKGYRGRKRTISEVQVRSTQECKSSLRPTKRLRRRKQSKDDDDQVRRKSYQNRSSCRRISIYLDLSLSTPVRAVNSRRVQGKPPRKKRRKSKENMLMPRPIHTEHSSIKGLDNLGQTCYFNGIPSYSS